MIPINTTFAPIHVFVDELVRSGMTHAVTCPGSRNAPIALTLAEHPGLTTVSVLDERSAGFVALGMAKTLGRPVAVTCTSGTAAANLMPAVVEAHEARVPLIVLTADRPPELREVGAGQAIDQIKLYGSFAKWFVEVGNLVPGRESAIHHRQLGCHAYATAAKGRPGPVHLNWPLREPLAPRPEQLDRADWEGRPGGAPWTTASEGLKLGGVDLGAAPERGLIVCGGDAGSYAPVALILGERLGWPVLAEPTSGARIEGAIAHYDLLVRSERFASERPDLVIRFGEMPTSKPLRAWLAGCRQFVVDPHLDWRDPTRTAESLLAIAPDSLMPEPHAPDAPDAADAAGVPDAADAAGVPDAGSRGDGRRASSWLARWRDADAAVADELAATEEPFEPLAYNVLAEGAETIWVSSSLPIRDFESYFPRTPEPLRILSNRGANGIDGVVSSAVGAALATGRPVHLVIGELALLHDVGGLVTAQRAGAQLAILCVNNGGGGIFDFLPVSEQADRQTYEDHIATPIPVDLAKVAALGGLEHHVVTNAAGVREHLVPGVLVELRVERASSLRKHRELATRIVARIDGGPSTSADAGTSASADAGTSASADAGPSASADRARTASAADGSDLVAILERGYALFDAGEIDSAMYTDDFLLEQTPGIPGSAHEFHGANGMLESTRELLEGFDNARFEPKSFERRGDWVIVPVTFIAGARGVEQRNDITHIWKFRDGKVCRMRVLAGGADPLAEIQKIDAAATS